MILHYKPGDAISHKHVGTKLSGLKPGEYVIEIKRNRAIRSIQANKYYFGVVLKTIAAETGIEALELHELFKFKFNAKIINFKTGWTEIIPGSTSGLDSTEFSVYLNKIKQYVLNQFAIDIPESDKIDTETWMQIQEQYDRVHNQF